MVSKTIQFDRNGGTLEIEFKFNGSMVVEYDFVLFDSDHKTRLWTIPGSNNDFRLDRFPLPLPVSSNVGRVIHLKSKFSGINIDNFSDYKIIAEVFQNGISLDEAEEKGKLDGTGQKSLIIIILK